MPDDYTLSESGVVEGMEDDAFPEEETTPEEVRSPICVRVLEGKLDSSGDLTFEQTAVSGTFRSSDTRTDPFIIFITAWRQGAEDGSKISHYYDGYGIAIATNTEAAYNDDQLNIFVVDNSLARKDVILENVIHTGWGDYAYLAATTKRIKPATDYHFELQLKSNGAMQFKVWESGISKPASPDITYGAHTVASDGLYWGVSLSKSDEYQAVFTSLNLNNIDDSYAGMLCKLTTEDFPGNFNAVVRGWGDVLNDPGNYGIKMYVYNFTSEAWDLKDSHTFGPGQIEQCLLQADDLSKTTYTDADGYCYIMVLSEDTCSFEDGEDARLHIDEIKLEAWSNDYVHVGGDGDVHIHDSSDLEKIQVDIYGINDKEWFVSSNTDIIGTLVLPVMIIESIEVLDALGVPTGVFLDSLTDYTFNVGYPSLRFSNRERNYFLFSTTGINVRVTYYTVSNVTSAQTATDELSRENVVYDLLIKAMLPYEVFIEADIDTDGTILDARASLTDWLNETHHTSISSNDIEVALQSFDDVNNASVTSLKAYKHNRDGEVDEITTDPLVLDTEGRDQFLTLNDATHIDLTAV